MSVAGTVAWSPAHPVRTDVVNFQSCTMSATAALQSPTEVGSKSTCRSRCTVDVSARGIPASSLGHTSDLCRLESRVRGEWARDRDAERFQNGGACLHPIPNERERGQDDDHQRDNHRRGEEKGAP